MAENIPTKVKQAFNDLKRYCGFVNSKKIITLLDWCKLSPENSKYAINFCSDLIVKLKKDFRTLYIDDVYYVRGLIYEVLQDYQKSIRDFTTSVNLYTDANGALFERGKIYYLLKEYDKALKDLNLVIKRDKRNGDYYYYRGLTYKALDQNEQAAIDLQKALNMAKRG